MTDSNAAQLLRTASAASLYRDSCQAYELALNISRNNPAESDRIALVARDLKKSADELLADRGTAG